MAAVFRWSLRLFALAAMLLFAALMVIFVVVTVDQFGEKQYVTDNVAGLPPVYVITALLVPFCAAFVAGFWLLFLDSFRTPPSDGIEAPVGLAETEAEEHEGLRARIGRWGREHRPHRPGWARKPGWAHWPRRAS